MLKAPIQEPTDPRIAPKEMIVTRFKSAQQKRQLREKDRSMTKITQLLKSPQNKSKTVRKKVPKSPNGMKKVTEKVVGEGREYYPNKLKRKFEEKRIFLRPKYESTTVVKLNKRKLGTPQKGSFSDGLKSPPVTVSASSPTAWSPEKIKSPVYSELSMEEVVRIVEDTESLDDEDLMEILTCPSPVWWEDPPDEGYIEESLWTSKPEQITKQEEQKKTRKTKTSSEKLNKRRKSKVNKTNKNINDEFKVDKIESRDDKFLKKRSKLENLLGNIKNKVRTNDNTSAKAKTEINNCNNSESIKKELIGNIENEVNSTRKSKTYSESTGSDSFADLSLRDDEMLSNLENMDIPVESNLPSKTEVDEHDLKLNNNGLDVNDIVLFENKISNNNTNLELVDIKFEPDSDSVNVPKTLPRLTKRPKIDNEPSSPSVRSFEDISSCETDTISDTNIKFITDDNENNPHINVTNTNMPTLVKCIKKEPEDKIIDTNEVFKAVNEKKDFITVYKIVSNEDRQKNNIYKNIPEYSNHVENLIKQESDKGQLNTFFRKCKNVRRKCKKNDGLIVGNKNSEKGDEEKVCDDCEPKKSITVARDENVKYCLKCSAIFDTEDCGFCSKTENSDFVAKIKVESFDNIHIDSETVNTSKDVH